MFLDRLIEKFPQSTIKKDEPLSKYSYTKTGGKADILIFPKEKNELVRLVDFIHHNDIPLTILGNASNLIVRDGGIRGVTMILTDMNYIRAEGERIKAASGARLIDTSYQALEESLTGLEFACGIPGSIGGAVFMNAGAYGGEVVDCIDEVTLLSRSGEVKVHSREEMEFSYRHSRIQDTGEIVIDVTFKLEKGDYYTIKERMDELTDLRESKQPLELPSCGSVFKRPEGHYTGKLIQDIGLQGFQIGGAQVSTKHAGFIVNVDHATATDYLNVIAHVQEVIYKEYGVQLETEVRVIGEEKLLVEETGHDS